MALKFKLDLNRDDEDDFKQLKNWVNTKFRTTPKSTVSTPRFSTKAPTTKPIQFSKFNFSGGRQNIINNLKSTPKTFSASKIFNTPKTFSSFNSSYNPPKATPIDFTKQTSKFNLSGIPFQSKEFSSAKLSTPVTDINYPKTLTAIEGPMWGLESAKSSFNPASVISGAPSIVNKILETKFGKSKIGKAIDTADLAINLSGGDKNTIKNQINNLKNQLFEEVKQVVKNVPFAKNIINKINTKTNEELIKGVETRNIARKAIADIEKETGIDKSKAASFIYELASQQIPQMGIQYGTSAIPYIGPAISAGYGYSMSFNEMLDDALANDVPMDQAKEISAIYAMYAAPLEYLPLDEVGKTQTKLLRKLALQFFKEGGTEGMQTGIQNYLAKINFDPERKLEEGVPESVLGGGVVGAGVDLAMTGFNNITNQTPTIGGIKLTPEQFALLSNKENVSPAVLGTNITEQINPQKDVAYLEGTALQESPVSVQEQQAIEEVKQTSNPQEIESVLNNIESFRANLKQATVNFNTVDQMINNKTGFDEYFDKVWLPSQTKKVQQAYKNVASEPQTQQIAENFKNEVFEKEYIKELQQSFSEKIAEGINPETDIPEYKGTEPITTAPTTGMLDESGQPIEVGPTNVSQTQLEQLAPEAQQTTEATVTEGLQPETYTEDTTKTTTLHPEDLSDFDVANDIWRGRTKKTIGKEIGDFGQKKHTFTDQDVLNSQVTLDNLAERYLSPREKEVLTNQKTEGERYDYIIKRINRIAELDQEATAYLEENKDTIDKLTELTGDETLGADFVRDITGVTADIKFKKGDNGKLGSYNFLTNTINIFTDKASKANAFILRPKDYDATVVHELWHAASKNLTEKQVNRLENEFQKEQAKFMKTDAYKENGFKGDGYKYSNIDEYFAESMRDQTFSKLSKKSNKVIQFLKNIYETIGYYIRTNLGLDNTDTIFKDFADRKLTKKQRDISLVKEQEINLRKFDDRIIKYGDTTAFQNNSDLVARERFNIPELEKISGGGSDRDVYDLGDKVLKVAKTARGLAQNMSEGEPYAPVPEAIENGKNYVVVQKAEKPNARTKQLVKDLKEAVDFNSRMPAIDAVNKVIEKYDKTGDEDMVAVLSDLNSYEVMINDLTSIRNWGTIDGEPVLVDAGTLGNSMLEEYKGVKNLNDPAFREAYNQSRQAKRQYGDTDKNTMYLTRQQGRDIKNLMLDTFKTAKSQKEAIKNLRELTDSYLERDITTNDALQEIKKIRAGIDPIIDELTGTPNGQRRADYALMKKLQGDPTVGPLLMELENQKENLDQKILEGIQKTISPTKTTQTTETTTQGPTPEDLTQIEQEPEIEITKPEDLDQMTEEELIAQEPTSTELPTVDLEALKQVASNVGEETQLTPEEQTQADNVSKVIEEDEAKITEEIAQENTPTEAPVEGEPATETVKLEDFLNDENKEMKKSKFGQTVKEGEPGTKEFKEKVKDTQYRVIHDEEGINYAKAYIKENGYDKSKEKFQKDPYSLETVAIAQELVAQANKDGRNDDAIDILEELTQKATRAGQANSALRYWNMLTPEGMQRKAQRIIENKQSKAKAKILEDVKPITKDISSEFTKINKEALDSVMESSQQALPGLLEEAGIKSTKKDIKKINDIIRSSYTEQGLARQELIDSLTKDTILSEDSANQVADMIGKQFDEATRAKKEQVLDRMFKKSDRKVNKKNLKDKLIELSNLGAFSERKYYEAIAEKLKIPVLTEELANTINKNMQALQNTDDPAIKNELMQETLEAISANIPLTRREIVDAYRYQNMLSNPKTQARNILGNTFQAYVKRPYDIFWEATAGLGETMLKGKKSDYKFTDVPKYYFNLINAIPKGVSGFFDVWNGKKQVLENPDIRTVRIKALPKALSVVTRFMEGMDIFFQEQVKAAEKARFMDMGKTETEADGLAQQYSDKLLFRSRADVKNETQQGEVNRIIDDIGERVTNALNVEIAGTQPGRWLVPFVQNGLNTYKQMNEYTVGGLGNLKGGKKVEVMGKQLGGAMLMMVGGMIAASGRATWAAPEDKEERKLFYASGKRPYSILINGACVPMGYFGPMGIALAVPSAAKYYMEDAPSAVVDSLADKFKSIATSSLAYLTSSTSLQTIGGITDMLSGRSDYTAGNIAGFAATQASLLSGLMRYVSQVVDPIYRKGTGIKAEFQKIIPGQSKNLEAYTTPEGEPSLREPVNKFLPYDIGIAKPEYDKALELRNQELKQNKLENKKKSDFEKLMQGFKLNKGGEVKGKATGIKDKELRSIAVYYGLDEAIDMKADTKQNKAKKEQAIYKGAKDLLENEEALGGEYVDKLLKEMDVDRESVEYYSKAKLPTVEKTGYILDNIKFDTYTNRQDLLNDLAQLRRRVADSMIMSDTVTSDLYNEGLITSKERTLLNKIYDIDPKTGDIIWEGGKTSSSTSGGAGADKIKIQPIKFAAVSPTKLSPINLKIGKAPSMTEIGKLFSTASSLGLKLPKELTKQYEYTPKITSALPSKIEPLPMKIKSLGSNI